MVQVELGLEIVFIVASQDTSKGTALLLGGQLIYPGETQVFAQNAKKERTGPMIVTLRPTV